MAPQRCPTCTLPMPCAKHAPAAAKDEQRLAALRASRCPTCLLPLPCATHGEVALPRSEAAVAVAAESSEPGRLARIGTNANVGAAGPWQSRSAEAQLDKLFAGMASRLQARIHDLQDYGDARLQRRLGPAGRFR
eukprot:TRINITY_DN47922_c0_g1_i1.p2 TRINITY_DN47922_c0_g1~~TRINITY_DN47922_c0_g1_i1.p2  ORF type:complete len:154 (-),score=27.16 TRINITY_DN47922_c0_g1_i1:184-588(-)